MFRPERVELVARLVKSIVAPGEFGSERLLRRGR